MAQNKTFNPRYLLSEVTASAGISSENGLNGYRTPVFTIDYTHFNIGGISPLGLRAGLSYIPEIQHNFNNSYAVPLSVVWRPFLRERSFKEKSLNATANFINSKGDVSSALLSYINIFSEFNAGLTPGYISDEQNTNSSHYDIHKINSTMLSADAGLKIFVNIWHFKLNIGFQYSYLIIENFEAKTAGRDIPRSRIMLNGGLSFAW